MKRLIIAPLMALGPVLGSSQLWINEACSKNVTVLADGVDATPDWVELHNAGADPIDLGGLFMSDDPEWLHQWPLPTMTLEAGGYLVLLHGTSNPDGLHFPFKLNGDGGPLYLTDTDYATVDMVQVPALHPDHAAGRDLNGVWSVFTAPTPGAPNTTTAFPGYAPMPVFSVGSGFYSSPRSVAISACATCEVHYSTDGRDPDANAPTNPGSVTVGQTGTLKAIAYQEGRLPSGITSASYLIGEETTLPVISISTHPDSLFDDTLGLYMLGPEADTVYPYWGANFWDERGIAVHLEYFDEHHVRRIDQNVELRIHGGRASRNKPQRPLRLTARDGYGDDRIHYGFFPEKPELDDFKRIILRNSGSDWCQAHYRDGFFHQIALHNGLDIDALAFKPSVVFLNGAYWGIHNIRERVDEDYLASNYGADPATLLLMDEENLVIQGDSLHFDSLQRYIRAHDMADDAHFRMADSLLDLHNFMDYFALEMFSGNSDWPSNNLKYWKPSVHTGKWRYLMYDMDAAMHPAPWLPNDFDMFYWVHVHREGFIHAEIYQSLIQRPEFRRLFLNRLADLMNTCLTPEALLAENEAIRNTIRSEIPRHFERWYTDPNIWHEQSGVVIPEWARVRGEHMRQDVLEWYDLPNTATIRFEVFPPGAAGMKVNTITPPLPFDGIYFNGNDINVSVEPRPGFTFSHWSYSAEPDTIMSNMHLQRSFPADGELVAHFKKDGVAVYAVPNPTGDRSTISYEAGQDGPLEISVWDARGRLLERWSMKAVTGVNRVPVDLSAYAAGLVEVRFEQNGSSNAVRILKQ